MKKAIFVIKGEKKDNLDELNSLLSQGWGIVNMCGSPIPISTGSDFHVSGEAVFLVILEN